MTKEQKCFSLFLHLRLLNRERLVRHKMFYNEAFLRLENRLPPKEQHIFEKILLLKLKLYRSVI
jgi:hypothetical protein